MRGEKAENDLKKSFDEEVTKRARKKAEVVENTVKPKLKMFHKKTIFCGQISIDTYILLCYHCVALFGRDDKFRPEILKFDREKV